MIPDYHDLWRAHEREREKELERLPKCSECGKPIQDERCYYFGGWLWCKECVNDHKVWTDDYMEE